MQFGRPKYGIGQPTSDNEGFLKPNRSTDRAESATCWCSPGHFWKFHTLKQSYDAQDIVHEKKKQKKKKNTDIVVMKMIQLFIFHFSFHSRTFWDWVSDEHARFNDLYVQVQSTRVGFSFEHEKTSHQVCCGFNKITSLLSSYTIPCLLMCYFYWPSNKFNDFYHY